jgi:hypothetical protein
MRVEAAELLDIIKEFLEEQVVLAAAAKEIILHLVVQLEILVNQTRVEEVELIRLLTLPVSLGLVVLVPVVPVLSLSLTHHK